MKRFEAAPGLALMSALFVMGMLAPWGLVATVAAALIGAGTGFLAVRTWNRIRARRD